MKAVAKKDFHISTKPNLSSQTLFHFTNSIEKLNSIIHNGLRAYYNYEKLPKGKKYYVAPMMCFCDIPLSTIKYHASKYGAYGIGIKRKAARDAGFTPVFYVHSDSKNITFSNKQLDDNLITPFIKQLLGYVPLFNERGIVKTKTSKITRTKYLEREQRKFYDEKEWRIIPSTKQKVKIIDYKNELELIKMKKENLEGNYI